MTVHDCGFGTSAQGAHGLYLRGPNLTVRDSHVWNARTSCVSVRFQGDRVLRNRLHGCGFGVSFFDYATAQGEIQIARNRIWDTRIGIYADTTQRIGFAITNNTILGGRADGRPGEGINLAWVRSARITNTIVAGNADPALRVDHTAAGYRERNNAFHVGTARPFIFGQNPPLTFAAYRRASKQGQGTTTADPALVSTVADRAEPAPAVRPRRCATGARRPRPSARSRSAATAGCSASAAERPTSAPWSSAVSAPAVRPGGSRKRPVGFDAVTAVRIETIDDLPGLEALAPVWDDLVRAGACVRARSCCTAGSRSGGGSSATGGASRCSRPTAATCWSARSRSPSGGTWACARPSSSAGTRRRSATCCCWSPATRRWRGRWSRPWRSCRSTSSTSSASPRAAGWRGASSGDLLVVPRVEAPVMSMPDGWEAAYTAKCGSKKRNLHRRRAKQLATRGTVEWEVARDLDTLLPALEESFALHDVRWAGRPDTSTYGTERGRAFQRAAMARIAPLGVPRIVTRARRRAARRVPLLLRPRGHDVRPPAGLRPRVLATRRPAS